MTAVEAGGATEGEDAIFAVNLTRSAEDVWADSICGPMSLADRSAGGLTDIPNVLPKSWAWELGSECRRLRRRV